VLTVSIDEIPDGGLEWTEKMGEQWALPLVAPLFKPNGVPVLLTVSLKRSDRNIVMHGDIATDLCFDCSRCAEPRTMDFSHSFVRVFMARSHHSSLPSDFDESQRADFTYFEGRTLELEPVAAEELVLALPPVPVCSMDCKGLCPICGRNLNNDACDCHVDVVDPRWRKLKEIKL